MPGKTGPPLRSRAVRLSRSSSFTCRVSKRCSEKSLRRSSPSVRGRVIRPGYLHGAASAPAILEPIIRRVVTVGCEVGGGHGKEIGRGGTRGQSKKGRAVSVEEKEDRDETAGLWGERGLLFRKQNKVRKVTFKSRV